MFMKASLRTLFALGLFFAITPDVNGQSKKFIKAMKKNIVLLDSADTEKEFLTCAKNFQKMKEKNNWLLNYYTGMSYALAATQKSEESNVDEYCDLAERFINKADSLSPDNSEIYVLKAMLATSRIMADPMSRWMQYGKKSYEATQKAMSLDPTNPRPYVYKGQSAYYTPGNFGGGCEKAKPLLETALEKFKNFKPASEIHPSWGKNDADEILTECNK